MRGASMVVVGERPPSRKRGPGRSEGLIVHTPRHQSCTNANAHTHTDRYTTSEMLPLTLSSFSMLTPRRDLTSGYFLLSCVWHCFCCTSGVRRLSRCRSGVFVSVCVGPCVEMCTQLSDATEPRRAHRQSASHSQPTTSTNTTHRLHRRLALRDALGVLRPAQVVLHLLLPHLRQFCCICFVCVCVTFTTFSLYFVVFCV